MRGRGQGGVRAEEGACPWSANISGNFSYQVSTVRLRRPKLCGETRARMRQPTCSVGAKAREWLHMTSGEGWVGLCV